MVQFQKKKEKDIMGRKEGGGGGRRVEEGREAAEAAIKRKCVCANVPQSRFRRLCSRNLRRGSRLNNSPSMQRCVCVPE